MENIKVELKSKRVLVIKKAEINDAEFILNYLNKVGGESDNLSYGAGGFRISVQQEMQYIERMNTSKTSVIFIGKIDNEIVSICSLTSHIRARLSHNSEINITVKKKFWGNSIGYFMIKTAIDFAINTNVTKVIHAKTNADNAKMIHLFKNMGFKEIGIYKKYIYINGEYKDSVYLNLYL